MSDRWWSHKKSQLHTGSSYLVDSDDITDATSLLPTIKQLYPNIWSYVDDRKWYSTLKEDLSLDHIELSPP